MARFPALVDRYGRPLQRSVLTQEVAAPTIGGVRQPISGYPADGLNPVRLASILREADQGDPVRFLELAETIEERDPHYQGVLGTRRRSVSQIDITVEPGSDEARDVEIADMVRDWLDRDVIDENRWLGTTGNILCLDSDGNAQNILGAVLDFAAEVPGCPGYHFNIFGSFDGPGGEGGPLKGYSSTGENFHLVNGVASRKYTAYRDERVWGTTVGNNFSDPFNADSSIGFPGDADYANPFQYSIVNGVASNIILYFLSGYLVDSGGIGPGDSDDYMVAFAKTDQFDSFGNRILIRIPPEDSA